MYQRVWKLKYAKKTMETTSRGTRVEGGMLEVICEFEWTDSPR